MRTGCFGEGVYSERERNEENGAITYEVTMTLDLIKVSPIDYNSHY